MNIIIVAIPNGSKKIFIVTLTIVKHSEPLQNLIINVACIPLSVYHCLQELIEVQ